MPKKVCCLDCLNFRCNLRLSKAPPRASNPFKKLGSPFSLFINYSGTKAFCRKGRMLVDETGENKLWNITAKKSWNYGMFMARKRNGLNHDSCEYFESDDMEVTNGK